MSFQFTNPWWLLCLPVALGWTIWLAWKTHVQTGPWRRWTSLVLRLVIVLALVLSIAGLQWLRPLEGINVFFLLDRSDSVPSPQQEMAREYLNRAAAQKKAVDRGGVVVFGNGASIETTPNLKVDVQKIQAVVGSERTDVASAVRLGTAAFPETGQKRLVVLSDGNENMGDALGAVVAARSLGVTVDVMPLGMTRGGDVSVQKLSVPSTLKKGQTFEVKIFAQADQRRSATLRLYRNDQHFGEEKVELAPGKNLFTFSQTLPEAGFYTYDVQLDAPGDLVPQNNRASSFASVRGDPRILVVSADPAQDQTLARALQSSRLEVKVTDLSGFPATLAEMQSYDTIFLSNIAAGDLGSNLMRLLESAVRDFGVGLVCVGGDQAYAAGGYRGTPLEATLPVDMELTSKKVLPSGALVLIMHGMEFNNGNQVARETALAALDALGPQDEMGVVLWDGTDRWLFPLAKVGDKKEMGRKISGMNQGDLPSFQHVMEMAYKGDDKNKGLKQSSANLKHLVVFSDGDPGPPSAELMKAMVNDRITVSTVMISGHSGPDTMIRIADQGGGRFYDVRDPNKLPQIFIKEAMVILKSAIFEEPFKPKLAVASEVVRGIGAAEIPTLRGYVCSTPKSRAEVPLISDKGDPILAHWQYGLGRSVAFTSDAKAKWAADWLSWGKYRQFWSQLAQWALRRVDNADFNTEVSIEKGEGVISVEALDREGNYRNFLGLQTIVVSPKGERQVVRLEQTGPGRYEARFPTREVGAYLLNLMELKDGKLVASQALGASLNYSPEFSATEPNHSLLQRLAEEGGGRVIPASNRSDPAVNPFLHDRLKTFQPRDLWEGLLKLAVLLFTLDVGVRRIYLDRAEWLKATATLRRYLFFWQGKPRAAEADESLAALLARREAVRARHTPGEAEPRAELFAPAQPAEAPLVLPIPTEAPAPAASGAPAQPAPEPAQPQPRATTTSRLLDAKRRAAKRLDKES
jgi:uncharacterized membrane protein